VNHYPRTTTRITLLAWAWLACLSATAHAFPTAPYYPLHVGNSWTGVEDGTVTTRTVAYDNVVLVTGVLAVAVESSSGEITYFTNDDNGLREAGYFYPATADLPAWMSVMLYPPLVDLGADATLGQSVSSSGQVDAYASGYGSLTLNYTCWSTPEAFETVTVPAGTFTALRVEQELTISGYGADGFMSSTQAQTLWLVKDVGLVKSELLSLDNGVQEKSLFTLSSYNVILPDSTPDPFSFAPITAQVLPGAVETSSSVQITGFDNALPIQVAQGEYSINSAPFTSTPGTINPGDWVAVRQQAGPNWGQTTKTVLTVGSVSAQFAVTTMAGVPSGDLIYYSGQSGDYLVGEGKAFISADSGYTLQAAVAAPWSPPLVTVTAASINGASNWNLWLRPATDAPLQVGSYENAVRAAIASQGTPGLDFWGNGAGCSEVSGRFDVLEATYDAEGGVKSLAVNFEQHCEGAAAALFGQLRFHSSIPIDISLPPTTAQFSAGWNLSGNSQGTPIPVAKTFGNAAQVVSLWKWLPTLGNWAFYSPLLADGGAGYAASKGFSVLSSIEGGAGFWLNAATTFSLPLPSGTAITAASLPGLLHPGWNLVSTADPLTPSQINAALGPQGSNQGAGTPNFASLWTWDPDYSQWYYYSPALDAQGNNALANYIAGKGYLDFAAAGKTLGPGIGFWLKMP